MKYNFEFNDWDLRELDSILIQPKKDGNGYTVHKTMKPEPGDGWDLWGSSLVASFEKAQENKKEVEGLQSSLNTAAIMDHQSALNRANDARDLWHNEYLKTCKKVEDIKAELEEKNNQIKKLQNNCNCLEMKVDDLQTELNNVKESAAAWKKKYKELNDATKTQDCSDWMKTHRIGILSKSERLDEFKSDNHFDIWEVRFSDHKTLNRIFKEYFAVDNDSEYEFNELIKGIESAFKRFNKTHELSMYEFFVYLGYFHFLMHLNALTCKALINTKWTESNPFDCNLNIVPPCGEDDNTVSYYIVFSTAPKYVGDEN